jgi:hypothetical protein
MSGPATLFFAVEMFSVSSRGLFSLRPHKRGFFFWCLYILFHVSVFIHFVSVTGFFFVGVFLFNAFPSSLFIFTGHTSLSSPSCCFKRLSSSLFIFTGHTSSSSPSCCFKRLSSSSFIFTGPTSSSSPSWCWVLSSPCL